MHPGWVGARYGLGAVSIDLRPHAVVAGGDAIARDSDGRIVFVSGALPGEYVRAEVFGRTKDYLRARLVDVVEASPHRKEPACPEVERGCGSCQWQHVTLEGQRSLKVDMVADALRRIAGVAQPAVEATLELPADNYRTTIRAAVVNGRAGYRRLRGHEVVEVNTCAVAHPLVEDLLVNGRYGRASEVVLRCGARTGERLALPDPTETRIEVPADVRRDHFHEVAAGRRWRISGPSFFQSRADGADLLAELVLAAADPVVTGDAVDLYSGVGLFAGVLAERGWRVTAVESSPASAADARVNLADVAVEVVESDVKRWESTAATFVVADPSRKGLGPGGVATVVAPVPAGQY